MPAAEILNLRLLFRSKDISTSNAVADPDDCLRNQSEENPSSPEVDFQTRTLCPIISKMCSISAYVLLLRFPWISLTWQLQPAVDFSCL